MTWYGIVQKDDRGLWYHFKKNYEPEEIMHRPVVRIFKGELSDIIKEAKDFIDKTKPSWTVPMNHYDIQAQLNKLKKA